MCGHEFIAGDENANDWRAIDIDLRDTGGAEQPDSSWAQSAPRSEKHLMRANVTRRGGDAILTVGRIEDRDDTIAHIYVFDLDHTRRAFGHRASGRHGDGLTEMHVFVRLLAH